MTRRCSILKDTPIVIPVILLFALPMLNACGSPDNFQGGKKTMNTVAMQQMEPPSPVKDEEVGSPSAGLLGSYANIPKKIIKEGTIRYAVRDYKKSRKELIAIVARNGAEIISERERRAEDEWVTYLDIRVPSAKFDSCLDELAGTDENLIEKQISSKDVTEEYVDVSARMKARKEVELRYLDILKQAKTVKDILEIEEQLKAIREEVEAAQGRLDFIDHNVSTSVIHLSFYQTFSNITPQGRGFFSRLFISIKDGWNGLLVVLVAVMGIWPVWLAVVPVFIILRKYIRRRRLSKATA